MSQILFKTHQLCFHDKLCYANLAIPQDKVTFIVGPSGTGKSTLLRLFNATISPTHGQILYQGDDLTNFDTIQLRKEVLLVGQSVFLFEGTIKDNFRQFYSHREMPAPSDEDMQKFLDLCCVPFTLDANCNIMSGGEKQRIYLAIFLSFCPQVLMLDEPTSALDSTTGHQVISNIITFAKAKKQTILIVSHDKTLTEKFAENTLTLERVETYA